MTPLNSKPSKADALLLTVVCFFSFFIFGVTDNLKGPTLPAMLAELGIDYGAGGNIFFGEYLGFIFAAFITGFLADRLGLKFVFILAGVLLAIGVSGYSSMRTPFLLSASLFVVGMGLGAFELGPNAVIVSLYHEHKGLYLNLMSVMHGLGSMLAPLFASLLLNMNASWRAVYRWDLLLIAVFFLASMLLRFPRTDEKAALDFRSIPKAAFKRQLPFFHAAILCYVAAEIGLASWTVVYLQDHRDMTGAASNNYLAIFFGLLMLGRFLGGFIVKRLGYLRATLIVSLLATLSVSIGIFTRFSLFIPLTGFFFSIIFPTLTAAVSDAERENANTILGVLFMFAGLGGLIGPWLAGWVSQLFGLQAGFSVIMILSLLTFLFISILNRSAHDQTA